jgi:hypothetical protein
VLSTRPLDHRAARADGRGDARRTGSSLKSGKIIEGMFVGADSKTVRILLDNGKSPRWGSRTRCPSSSRRASRLPLRHLRQIQRTRPKPVQVPAARPSTSGPHPGD